MAKKNMVAREKVRLNKSSRAQKSRAELREIIISPHSSYEEKQEAVDKRNKRSRDESRSRIQRRCQQKINGKVCGRPRGVYRKFGLCRIHLREAAMRGDIPGLVKDSW